MVLVAVGFFGLCFEIDFQILDLVWLLYVCEWEGRSGSSGSSVLVLGGIRLGMVILGSRWFVELEVSPSWLGVCWWILLPRQWVVGWSTQVVGARAQCPTPVRSSVSVKEWSSMPLQWPLAMPPHCGPKIRSSCSDILSWFLSKVSSCYVMSKLEAYHLGLCPCSYFRHCVGK